MNILSRIIIKRPWAVVGATIILAGVAGIYGLSVFSHLQSGGFEDAGTSSGRSDAIIKEHFKDQRTDVLLLFTSTGELVASNDVSTAIQAQLKKVSETAGVEGVTSAYSTGSPSFTSTRGHQTFAAVRISGDEDAQTATLHKLEDTVKSSGNLQVAYGGLVAINDQINKQVAKDLEKAELLSFPILAILLVMVFRSVIAAIIPLVLGGLSILVAFLLVRLLTTVTDVSVYAINIITLMGLGLAIDYSLFIVSRFREELATGKSVDTAIARTLQTAGRTVFFSALTVIISLLGLLVFPQAFLRSMGLGGAAAVGATAILALTILPAVLKLVGKHVNSLALPGLHKRLSRPAEHGTWYRYSRFIMRYPLVTLAVAVEILVVFALPFMMAKFSTPDATTVPTNFSSRQVDDQLKSNFDNAGKSTINLAIKADASTNLVSTRLKLDDYLNEIKTYGGINDVQVQGMSGNYIYAQLVEVNRDQSTAATQTLQDVRNTTVPKGWTVESGGQTAALTDLLNRLKEKIPLATLIIVLATAILMFLMLGSVIMPIKAVLLNIMSLSAAFGILTWIFQDRHFVKTFGFVSNGTIDATQPVLIFAIAFGLAMDYELFLLSRIKEEYDRTGNNTLSVAIGVERTAGIITSAALMLVIVIGLFATGKISIIQQVGVGLAVAVAIDATVVRMMLVPSAMELLGKFNWWAPAPLARLAKRIGIGEVS